jgi:hypothetical protein
MSRGLGRIERVIVTKIEHIDWVTDARTTVHLSSWDLLCGVYTELTDEFTPAQCKAVVRAMHSFVRKHPRYTLIGGQGRKQLYLYERDDPLSMMWAKLQVASRKPLLRPFIPAR